MLAIQKELRAKRNENQAANLQRFFKTGKGEYGEGDIFLGLKVPETRRIAKRHKDLSPTELQTLINSEFHEERLAALVILRHQYEKATDKKPYVDFYLSNRRFINNWDLVDLSVHYILGDHLADKDRSQLYKFAKSRNLWERRMAIIATAAFINKNQFQDTLQISEILLKDKHDLIHKAVGWMLREVGKRNQATEEEFLKKHYKKMPRTMLRYAIEKFPEELRQAYLKGEVK